MWTRPIFPSSSWTNAPYGVMRWTRPSTTAPTASSAIGTPFRRWTRTSGPRALSHRPHEPSTARTFGDGGVQTTVTLARHVDQLDTLDDGLIKPSGQLGNPPLKIGRPDLPEQVELEFESGRGDDEGESAEESEDPEEEE